MDRQVVETLVAREGPLALVTVADIKGSSPRHPGSAMLVGPQGYLCGTIGGGKGEALAIQAGKEALATGQSRFFEAEMLGDEAEGPAMICGGINRMIVEVVTDKTPYRKALDSLKAGKRVLIVRNLGGSLASPTLEVEVHILTETGAKDQGEAYHKALSAGSAQFLEGPDGAIFLDPGLPQEKLLILGGGHVGLALARASQGLGFDVTVVDDRPDFADPGRFPPEVRTLVGNYTEMLDPFPFDEATYAVIVSRGHLFDLECSRAVLKRPFRYAGLIGSKRKVALLKEQLTEDGFSQETIGRLYSPIGLAIGSETPGEIAISILAQIIAVRRNLPIMPPRL